MAGGPFDINRFRTGGAMRPDSISGMRPQFSSALANLFAAAPPEIQQNLRISSGYRSPERQAQLWQGALAKYGSPEVARKWVAPPGHSQHEGGAADLKYLSPSAQEWAHKNAAAHGLAFPLSNENWHIELAGGRGGHGHAKALPPGLGDVVGPSAPGGSAVPSMVGQPMPQLGDALAPALGIAAAQSVLAEDAAQKQRALVPPQEDAAAEQIRRKALYDGVASLYG